MKDISDIMEINDFPKLECPFKRKLIDGTYIVYNEISDGYEWVFNDPNVFCVEKIHGTCCAVVIENGVVISLFNRTNRIPFIGGTLSKAFTQGVNNAVEKNRLLMTDGVHWGELIGPKIQKNDYKLEENEWLPFEWMREHLTYHSWHKYSKTYDSIREWFRKPISEGGIFSLFMRKKGIEAKPEGVVFTHPDGKMAKIRLDMFDFWEGKRHGAQQEKEPV